jgi:hypothetical protein
MNSARRIWYLPHAIKPAFQSITELQRRELIALLDPYAHGEELVQAILGGSVQAFQSLLLRTELKSLRFAPLRVETPTSEWLRLVECALNNGSSVSDMLSQWAVTSRSWAGPESQMWSTRAKELRSMSSTVGGVLRDVLDGMAARCDSSAQVAARQKRIEEIHGD